MPLSLQAPAVSETSLQDLIETWFDSAGMQNALQIRGKATVIHLNGFCDEKFHEKTYSLVTLPADLCVRPHRPLTRATQSDAATVTWLSYEIKGLTWHQGPTAYTGHHRTLLKETNGWKHYDDNVPPTKENEVSKWVLQRYNLVWLVAKAQQ